jgi:hypothetical protein
MLLVVIMSGSIAPDSTRGPQMICRIFRGHLPRNDVEPQTILVFSQFSAHSFTEINSVRFLASSPVESAGYSYC